MRWTTYHKGHEEHEDYLSIMLVEHTDWQLRCFYHQGTKITSNNKFLVGFVRFVVILSLEDQRNPKYLVIQAIDWFGNR